MELDYKAYATTQEINLARKFMNTKIDIFQDIDSYVIRGKDIKQGFKDSYEHEQIQNDSARILSNSSNLLLYSLGNNINDLSKTKHTLKTTFSLTNEDIGQPFEDMENEYTAFKKKLMAKKLETDTDYIYLCNLINHPSFHQLMVTRNDILKYVISHKYLQYHPKYEEIIKKYRLLHLAQHLRNHENNNQQMDEDDDNGEDGDDEAAESNV
jgi:hypothetical protein